MKSRYDEATQEGSPVAAQGSTEKTDRTFRFGPFELSERQAELRKSGVRIKLQEQPFRVLVELVANSGSCCDV